MIRLLKTNPNPTVAEVEDYFDATVCRCTGKPHCYFVLISYMNLIFCCIRLYMVVTLIMEDVFVFHVVEEFV